LDITVQKKGWKRFSRDKTTSGEQRRWRKLSRKWRLRKKFYMQGERRKDRVYRKESRTRDRMSWNPKGEKETSKLHVGREWAKERFPDLRPFLRMTKKKEVMKKLS